MGIRFAETENYPLSACISDTGGAAGLFLGLHVIGELKINEKNYKNIISRGFGIRDPEKSHPEANSDF